MNNLSFKIDNIRKNYKKLENEKNSKFYFCKKKIFFISQLNKKLKKLIKKNDFKNENIIEKYTQINK
jgi:hypothetical protein